MPVIILIVSRDVSGSLLKGGAESEDWREILAVADEGKGVLAPIHPDADDTELLRYFSVSFPNQDAAEASVGRFLACKAVTSAYLKPQDEMP